MRSIGPKSRISLAHSDDLLALNGWPKKLTSAQWHAHCHVF